MLHLPLTALTFSGLPGWARIAIAVVVVAAALVGVVSMIAAMRRNRELQDGAPPLPPRPWSQPSAQTPLPGPPSPAAPDDAPLKQRLAEIDDAFAAGRIDASERERARRALLGDDPDGVR
ncbi:hypothetical protein [Agrococcus jejuensis]|uniref:hypothetical protein n=1 Tax=Agrococcus jejuensis TaxID=399736 RepID=UPI0011A9059D|nr:hypothetical protein [Agrococcus jejuensis]